MDSLYVSVLNKEPEKWTVSEVGLWINSSVWAIYEKDFVEAKISGKDLLALREGDLHQLGIKALGTKKAILKAIRNLSGNSSTSSAEGKASKRHDEKNSKSGVDEKTSKSGTDDKNTKSVDEKSFKSSVGEDKSYKTLRPLSPTSNFHMSTSSTSSKERESARKPEDLFISCLYPKQKRGFKIDTNAAFIVLQAKIKELFDRSLKIEWKEGHGEVITINSEDTWRTVLNSVKGNKLKLILRENQYFPEEIQEILDCMEQPAVIMDSQGIILSVTQSMVNFFGYKPFKLVKRPLHVIFGEEIDVCKIVGSSRDVFVKHRNGEKIAMNIKVTIVKRDLLLGLFKQKTVTGNSDMICLSNSSFFSILNDISKVVVVIDQECTIVFANKAACQSLCYELDELTGQNAHATLFKQKKSNITTSSNNDTSSKPFTLIVSPKTGRNINMICTVKEHLTKDTTLYSLFMTLPHNI